MTVKFPAKFFIVSTQKAPETSLGLTAHCETKNQLSNSVSLLISVTAFVSLPLSRLLAARQRHQRLHLRADPDDGAEVSDAPTDATL